ncbi:MAG TPA: 6,7-dimethyl-8-ribityllumazine synthase [Iamia sp.]
MAGDAVSDRRVLPTLQGTGVRVAVVAGRFNDLVTFRLLDGVERGLRDLGAPGPRVEWVPGAFEIPLAAKAFAESGDFDAVIGLGCVIRGATTHYEAVAGECAAGILRAGLATGVPVIFGVLTTEDLDQALERSEGPGGHNVGEEGAHTAVEMVRLLERIGKG